MWEALGHIHLGEWLWTLLVSAINTVATVRWAWVTQWGHLPIYLVALATFTLSIWLINGLIWIARQSRPSHARITFDYSHGLALDGLSLGLDLQNNENTFELRPKFLNVSGGPIKYSVEKLDFKVEDRIVQIKNMSGGVLPKGVGRTFIPNAGFRREAYDQFSDRARGEFEYSLVYGHPDDRDYARRAKGICSLDIFKMKDKDGEPVVTINWIFRDESDTALS